MGKGQCILGRVTACRDPTTATGSGSGRRLASFVLILDCVEISDPTKGTTIVATVTEHQEAATAAGLQYVTDGQPGISRKRVGKGWAFYGPRGKRIADKKVRQRILSLVIPPAWTDVWISPNPKGHIQVTARDVKGRKTVPLSRGLPRGARSIQVPPSVRTERSTADDS